MPPTLQELCALVPGSTPVLMQWLQTQLGAGHSPELLRTRMHAAGWSEGVAQAALQALHASTTARQPGPNLTHGRSTIATDDREIHVLLRMEQPQLVLFGNVLSPQECEALIRDAEPALLRSRTVATHEGGEEINPDRTSEGMFFRRGQTPLIARIEARIAQLLQWPISHGEGLQVLHYAPGTEYKPHHDYFDPHEPHSAPLLARGGQRVATLVLYLSDVTAGGATSFPESRLHVLPRQGNAVFFAYPQAAPESLTLHGGDPVLEGAKWIATKWLRTETFE